MKKLPSWKDYIPGDIPCVVVTSDFKMLRKVSATQTDEQNITFIQMVEGKPVESKVLKDIIVEISPVFRTILSPKKSHFAVNKQVIIR